MMKKLILVLIVLGLAAPALSACGRKNAVEPGDGKKNEFPRQYPRQ